MTSPRIRVMLATCGRYMPVAAIQVARTLDGTDIRILLSKFEGCVLPSGPLHALPKMEDSGQHGSTLHPLHILQTIDGQTYEPVEPTKLRTAPDPGASDYKAFISP